MSKKTGLGALLLGFALTGLALAEEGKLAPTAKPEAAPCAVSFEQLLAPEVSTASVDTLFDELDAAIPLVRRTCKCSCGQPCQTDADCGLGGVCRAGITCC